MRQTLRNLILGLAAFSLFTGCDSKKAAEEAASQAALVINGQLNSSSFSAKPSFSPAKLSVSAVNSVADLELYGLAFSNPPEAQSVSVGADGSFSLSFSANAAGAPISLVFRDKTDPTNEVGVVKFVDNSKVGMDGSAKKSGSISLSGTVSLGNLALNSNGEVTVDVSTITSSVSETTVAAADAFDFTGVWAFSKAASHSLTVPTGYSDICDETPQGQEHDKSCDGPSANQTVYIKRVTGKEFTPDQACSSAVQNDTFSGTCAGTTGTTDAYAIQVWASQNAFTGCGSRLGFTNDEAKAFGRVDFSGDSTITADRFQWASGWTDGWKHSSATATHDIHNCQSVPVTMTDGTTRQGWKCTASDGKYQIGLGGGCYDSDDASQAKIHVTNWSAMNSGQCTEASANLPAGYNSQNCTYSNVDHDGDSSTATKNITCNHTHGEFNSDGTAATSFDFNNVSNLLNSGAACSSATGSSAHELAQLRCYADHFYQNRNDNECVRNLRTNWEAQNPEDFVVGGNGPQKAENQFVMSLFEYTGANSGYFQDTEVYSEGIQVGNSYSSCRVSEDFKMSFRPLDGSNPNIMVMEFETKTRLLDTDKAECVAAAADSNSRLRLGVNKHIGVMARQ